MMIDSRALASDVRLTFRLCRRSLVSTCSAILLLGTGVSVAVLGRAVAQDGSQQGLPTIDRIGSIGFAYAGRDVGTVPRSVLAEFCVHAQSFAQVVGVELAQTEVDAPDGESGRITVARVTDGFFDAVGISPVIGRRFADDEHLQHAPVLVVSHEFWRTRFRGDASAIGATLSLDGTRYTVVGVMARGFAFPRAQAWAPSSLRATTTGNAANSDTRGYVLLWPGVTWEAARAEVSVLAARFAAAYPESMPTDICIECAPEQARTLRLQSRREQIGMRSGQTFLLFQAPTLLLLATTLVSVAGLAALKMQSRGGELAMRIALGATRLQMIRYFLLEAMLLGLPAAICAVGFLRLELWYLSRIAPAEMQWLPAAVPFSQYVPTVGVCCLLASVGIAVTLAIGFLWRQRRRSGLSPSELSSTAGFRAVTFKDLLVVVQVAVAGLTLVGAALFAGAQASFGNPHFGFDTNTLLSIRVALAPHACTRDCNSELIDLARGTSQRVRQIPGVAKVTVADMLPQPLPGNGGDGSLAYLSSAGVEFRTRCLFVDEGLFGTLGVGLAGREIGEADVSRRRQTLVISDALAKSLWKNENPIGRSVSVRLFGEKAREFEVVGVAPDLNYLSIDSRSRRMAYLPLSGLQEDATAMTVLVRARQEHSAQVLEALQAASSIVQDNRVSWIPETYDAARARGSYRDMTEELAFLRGLMLSVSSIAVVIAVAGVAVVTWASVLANQRTLAIRAALGASPATLVAHVLTAALSRVLAGVVLVLPLLAVPLLRPQPSIDPAWAPLFWNLTWWSVMLCGATVIFLGCYLPARIAARTNLAMLTR